MGRTLLLCSGACFCITLDLERSFFLSSPEESFPGFLEDPDMYDIAQAFWASSVRFLERTVGHSEIWQIPWCSEYAGDGTKLRDGNPILSAVNHTSRRGIRIIQSPWEEDCLPFTWWTANVFEEEHDVEELVICLVATSETTSKALDLLSHWIADEEISSAP